VATALAHSAGRRDDQARDHLVASACLDEPRDGGIEVGGEGGERTEDEGDAGEGDAHDHRVASLNAVRVEPRDGDRSGRGRRV
jgi:hypothetical protein